MRGVFQTAIAACWAVALSVLSAPEPALAQNPPNPDRNQNWPLGIASADPERAWALFEAVNTPIETGLMTWEASGETYLPGGVKPTPWGAPPPPRILDLDGDGDGDNDGQDDTGNTLSGGVHLSSSAGPSFVTGGLRDLKGRPIYSEVRLNKTAFDAVLLNTLYNVEGQLAFADAGRNFTAPDSAMEIKVTWRILDGDEDPSLAASYLQTSAIVYENGQKVTYTLGMTGMNIISKRGGAWYATAFEHGANSVETLDDRFPHVALALRVPTNFAAVNATKRTEHAGTALAHYFSVGGQDSFVASDGGPLFLTNTQQETLIVRSSACLSCHAYSAIARVDGIPTRFLPLATNNKDGTGTGYFGASDQSVLQQFATFDMFWSVIAAQPINPENKTRMITVQEYLSGQNEARRYVS